MSTVFGLSPHAYVTDVKGTSVHIIDLNSNAIESIDGFDRPRVVKVTADGSQALVGQGDSSLVVIDTHTHTILPVSLEINHPVALAITPDNEYAYIVSVDGSLTVVNIPEYTIDTIVTGFNKPGDVKISPDGAFAYVTNAGNGTVSVVRTSDHTIVDTIVGMQKPVGLTLTNDGQYGYVSDLENDSIYVIRTSNNMLIDEILGFNAPKYIAMSQDGSYFYVTSQGNNRVNKVRISDSKLVSSITIPLPSSIATTKDGLHYLVGSNLGAVFKVQVFGDVIQSVFPGIANPSNIAPTLNNAPDISLNGCQVDNDPTNIFNRITWNTAPGNPTSYKIYKDAASVHLITTLLGTDTEFVHMHLREGQTYSYYLIAEYANGFSTTLGNVEVTPSRTCIGM
jgi:YVTN family beta-propeller protein